MKRFIVDKLISTCNDCPFLKTGYDSYRDDDGLDSEFFRCDRMHQIIFFAPKGFFNFPHNIDIPEWCPLEGEKHDS